MKTIETKILILPGEYRYPSVIEPEQFTLESAFDLYQYELEYLFSVTEKSHYIAIRNALAGYNKMNTGITITKVYCGKEERTIDGLYPRFVYAFTIQATFGHALGRGCNNAVHILITDYLNRSICFPEMKCIRQ